MKKELNSFRHELGLKPVSRILHAWMFSSCLNAAVFSRSIGPRAAGLANAVRGF